MCATLRFLAEGRDQNVIDRRTMAVSGSVQRTWMGIVKIFRVGWLF